MALILFNKPFNVLCQFTPEPNGPERQTLKDYIDVPGVYPAGRLDTDSEGLLLLTDDGRLQSRIADPRFKMPKTYLAQVEGEPDEAALDALPVSYTHLDVYKRQRLDTDSEGPVSYTHLDVYKRQLKDGRTLPAEAERIDDPALWPRDPPVRFRKTVADCWISLTIREGKNRQVRRMTAAVGHPTLRLVRWAIGEWTLEGVQPGEWREVG
ncbi:pseudouridine synthase [Sphingobium sp. B2]|uniref:pseudouridine synthase n=1 Tax=Sphingobium sp. B2 TaxID=2583228 RepID=UPI0011A99F1B|nr:pseudouridine synthase [Sphingobium sp. B2]